MFKVVHPLSRLRSGLAGTLVLFLSAFALTACIVTADQSVEAQSQGPARPGHRRQDPLDRSAAAPDRRHRRKRHPAAERRRGRRSISATAPTPPGAALAERDGAGGSGYDLNFENAPVATVAKVILGDVLKRRLRHRSARAGNRDAGFGASGAEGGCALRAGERAADVRRRAGARSRRQLSADPGRRSRPRRHRPRRRRRSRPRHQRGAAALRVGAERVQAARRLRRQGQHVASRQRPQHPDHHRQRLRPRGRDRHHPELRRRLDEGTIGRHLPGAQFSTRAADLRAREDHGFRRRRHEPERRQVPGRSAGSTPSSWSARSRNISSAPAPGSRGSTVATPRPST